MEKKSYLSLLKMVFDGYRVNVKDTNHHLFMPVLGNKCFLIWNSGMDGVEFTYEEYLKYSSEDFFTSSWTGLS